MKCNAKHVLEPKEWACPICGSNIWTFYHETIDPMANMECEKLHAQDVVICEQCGKTWTGTQLSKLFMKKHNMVKCPHCNGAGMVKKNG